MRRTCLVDAAQVRGFVRSLCAVCALVAAGTALSAPAQAAQILTGATGFSDPDGGVASPGFSGVLAFELYDSTGGTSALAGGQAAPTLGSDFTLVFQIQMNPDSNRIITDP